jgi:hypothetical protein
MIDLGHYGNHELFMTKADFNNGVLSNFVMFMMPNTPPTESTKTTGTGGGAGGSHRSPQFVPQSLGIQPPG